MSNPERSPSPEREKGTAPKDSLEPKKHTRNHELGGFSTKQDAQESRNEKGSAGSHQVFNEILNPELAECLNSTETKGKLPQPHTDELRYTDELHHTDELCDTGELDARPSKLNENDLRSDERLKVTHKLVSG